MYLRCVLNSVFLLLTNKILTVLTASNVVFQMWVFVAVVVSHLHHLIFYTHYHCVGTNQ